MKRENNGTATIVQEIGNGWGEPKTLPARITPKRVSIGHIEWDHQGKRTSKRHGSIRITKLIAFQKDGEQPVVLERRE